MLNDQITNHKFQTSSPKAQVLRSKSPQDIDCLIKCLLAFRETKPEYFIVCLVVVKCRDGDGSDFIFLCQNFCHLAVRYARYILIRK